MALALVLMAMLLTNLSPATAQGTVVIAPELEARQFFDRALAEWAVLTAPVLDDQSFDRAFVLAPLSHIDEGMVLSQQAPPFDDKILIPTPRQNNFLPPPPALPTPPPDPVIIPTPLPAPSDR